MEEGILVSKMLVETLARRDEARSVFGLNVHYQRYSENRGVDTAGCGTIRDRNRDTPLCARRVHPKHKLTSRLGQTK